MLGVNAPMISGLEEALQTLVPEANDHKSSVMRNITIGKVLFFTVASISFKIRLDSHQNLREAETHPTYSPEPEIGIKVLMIPIPQAGILRRVEGVLAAGKVPYIEEVVIHVREGYELVPLPEGSSYLGFIFARAPSAVQAEAALRAAHACLRVVVMPLWKGVRI